MFILGDVLHDTKKNATKLSRVRCTEWESSLCGLELELHSLSTTLSGTGRAESQHSGGVPSVCGHSHLLLSQSKAAYEAIS